MLKEFVTDEKGNIKSVILNYKIFKEVEELIDDYLLGKIMLQSANDDEILFDEAKKMVGFN
jgi:hypothetical protein